MTRALTVADLEECFVGLVPTVLATASASGTPNVTYLSRTHPVDDERIAVSNQFLSKSSRNAAENPRASLLLIRPSTYEEYRVSALYERTDRSGPVFERLRNDLAMIAALTAMEDVFRLSAADIFRVTDIERLSPPGFPEPPEPMRMAGSDELGELCARISRCGDLETILAVTLDGLDELLGIGHSQLLLADETATKLFTIATHGYDETGVGAEVAIGEGVAGLAAQRCAPVVVPNLSQMDRYTRSVRESMERSGGVGAGHSIPPAGLANPGSQLAVPALAMGQLVGSLFVEDERGGRFSQRDAAVLGTLASLLASSVQSARAEVRSSGALAPATGSAQAVHDTATTDDGTAVGVRHFTVDGSTFLDGEYLIKGVAGRLLWSLLRQYRDEGRTEFTNREIRLDPSLDLPDFRDNFESRLILLKRRLEDRDAPLRIVRTGRGRFRVEVLRPVRLELRDQNRAG